MENVNITNVVKLYTILLLNKKPMHGYELIKELEECLVKKISASHVYPFLKLLKKENLIALKDSGNRDKKQYALTKKGKKFSNEIMSRSGIMVDAYIKNKVKTCTHCSCKIYEGGHKEKIGEKNHYFCCIHCAKSYKS